MLARRRTWWAALRLAAILGCALLIALPHLASAQVVVVPRGALGAYLFGRNIGVGIREAMNAAAEMGAAKQELSAEIARARRDFWQSYDRAGAGSEAEARFQHMLFSKDFYYLTIYLPEGLSGRARLMRSIGGDVDGGIPQSARSTFFEWIIALREFHGGRRHYPDNQGEPDMVQFSVDGLLRALSIPSIEKLYDAYKLERDRAEFTAAGKEQDFAALVERYRAEEKKERAAAAPKIEWASLAESDILALPPAGVETPRLGTVIAAYGNRAIIGGRKGPLRLVDLENRKVIADLGEGNAAAMNGKWIAIGDQLATRTIDIETGYNRSRLRRVPNAAAGVVRLHDAATGRLVRTLAPDDSVATRNRNRSTRPRFGETVAVSGDFVVVGAGYEDVSGAAGLQVVPASGAVYIFEAQGGRQVARLTGHGDKHFGRFLAASGDILAVGAPGGNLYEEWDPYVATFRIPSGEKLVEIRHPDPKKASGFGTALAISGDTLLVGAPIADASVFAFGVSDGRARYTLSGREILASEKNGYRFGLAVSAFGDRAVISAAVKNVLVVIEPSSGKILAGLEAPPRIAEYKDKYNDGSWFGTTVALSGRHLLASAPTADFNAPGDVILSSNLAALGHLAALTPKAGPGLAALPLNFGKPGGPGGAQAEAAEKLKQLIGNWTGTYHCGQGVTGVTIRFSGDDPAKVEASFKFYAVERNPGVPSGELLMQGKLDVKNLKFDFYPTKWVRQPPGYAKVGIAGRLIEQGRRLEVWVKAMGCKQFTVARN